MDKQALRNQINTLYDQVRKLEWIAITKASKSTWAEARKLRLEAQALSELLNGVSN